MDTFDVECHFHSSERPTFAPKLGIKGYRLPLFQWACFPEKNRNKLERVSKLVQLAGEHLRVNMESLKSVGGFRQPDFAGDGNVCGTSGFSDRILSLVGASQLDLGGSGVCGNSSI